MLSPFTFRIRGTQNKAVFNELRSLHEIPISHRHTGPVLVDITDATGTLLATMTSSYTFLVPHDTFRVALVLAEFKQ
jgi:hypothetical protein